MGIMIFLTALAIIGLCLYVAALRTVEYQQYMDTLKKMERNHNRSLRKWTTTKN